MEKFVEHIKERFVVNYENEEVKKIMRYMNKYLATFQDFFNQTTNDYKIKSTKLCGSMEEKTRIWEIGIKDKTNCYEPILEFDYWAVISPKKGTEITKSSHVGYMNLYLESDDCWLTESKTILSPKTVNAAFLKKLVDIMKTCPAFTETFELNAYNFLRRIKNCDCSLCKVGQMSLQQITMKELTFEWTIEDAEYKIDTYYYNQETGKIQHSSSSTVLVKLDFLPAFQIGEYNNMSSIRPYLLVPKVCHHQHEYCWRMSFCIEETQEFNNASQFHRDAYKFVKALIQMLDWNEIPSYELKNVLFCHLKECKNETDNALPCVFEVLAKFGNYIRKGKIPHYDIPELELGRFLQSKDYKAFGEFLVHLSQILGKERLTGEEMLSVEGMDKIQWASLIRKELYETADDIDNGELNQDDLCYNFEAELAKVQTQFEAYKMRSDNRTCALF